MSPKDRTETRGYRLSAGLCICADVGRWPTQPRFWLEWGSSGGVQLGNPADRRRGLTVLQEGAESQPDVISVVAREIASVDHGQGGSGVSTNQPTGPKSLWLKILLLSH